MGVMDQASKRPFWILLESGNVNRSEEDRERHIGGSGHGSGGLPRVES